MRMCLVLLHTNDPSTKYICNFDGGNDFQGAGWVGYYLPVHSEYYVSSVRKIAGLSSSQFSAPMMAAGATNYYLSTTLGPTNNVDNMAIIQLKSTTYHIGENKRWNFERYM
jgi:hypothetical protein